MHNLSPNLLAAAMVFALEFDLEVAIMILPKCGIG